MHMEIHKALEEKMLKTLNVLKEDLHSVRAGRANPQLLDKIHIDYYGTSTPIAQMASITAPEPRMLMIQPYDASVVKDIEKAINMSDLGLNPSNDGRAIRLIIPALTEERRKDLTKVARKGGEDTKVALRNERREANEKLKKAQKAGEITEDELKRAEDEVQKSTDKYIKLVDEVVLQKEKEIMEV